MSDNYIYAVARVRSRELGLLGRQDVDQLMACRSYDECLRVLSDKGWGAGEGASSEAVLAAEEEKTWAFIHELTDDLTPFQVLLFPTDYNNLKAAIKAVVTSVQPQDVFLPGGAVDPQLMLRCVREGDFTELPGRMAQAADDAYHTLLQTEDGQLCDVILDQACLADVLDCGRNSDAGLQDRQKPRLFGHGPGSLRQLGRGRPGCGGLQGFGRIICLSGGNALWRGCRAAERLLLRF